MKWLLLLLILTSSQAFAKTILISGFDAFDGSKGNNSQIIGKLLSDKFKDSEITVHYCQLETKYFKSSEQLKDCLNSLKTQPDFIIGLGENNCSGLKYEQRAINWMKDISQDNDGYARIDLRLTSENKIYILEANPNPNIASDDEFAKSAAYAGIKYKDLLEKLF